MSEPRESVLLDERVGDVDLAGGRFTCDPSPDFVRGQRDDREAEFRRPRRKLLLNHGEQRTPLRRDRERLFDREDLGRELRDVPEDDGAGLTDDVVRVVAVDELADAVQEQLVAVQHGHAHVAGAGVDAEDGGLHGWWMVSG
jgi:hypothetical protein